MRTIRLFSILDQLRGKRRPMSAQSLAERSGVSIRTIYRDVKTLQSMGAPIRGEGGIGYQIEDGFFLPPLRLDPDELDTLVLGVRMVAARGDKELKQTAERLMGKLEDVLAGEDSDFNRPLLAPDDGINPQHSYGMSSLKSAIRNRNKSELVYVDNEGSQSSRIVRPLGLTAFEKVWVLTAWCEYRSDFRNFRLDRIVSLSVTDETFGRERGKEFSDYIRSL